MFVDDIHAQFIDFYQNDGFQLLPRAPMLHPSIPMSFVMSAGLVQVETSLLKTPWRTSSKYLLIQECFRHFDLDLVGKDDFHLSLFDMPGAFIFEADAKEKAIKNIWSLIIELLGIDKNRIWVSFFNGGKVGNQNLTIDNESREIWLDIGLQPNRLVGLGPKHNYWTQGGGLKNNEKAIRKCGKNTELFYDRGIEKSCNTSCRPGCRCGRFLEFSNLLFVTHELHSQSNMLSLSNKPFIETVIGSERIAMILQNSDSIFDIEKYKPLVNTTRKFKSTKNIPERVSVESERVIVDHLKALCILIADGAPPPGKGGRKRIIRQLIRRVLTRMIILEIKTEDFLPIIIQKVLSIFNKSHLKDSQNHIKEKMINLFEIEDKCFHQTIERGRKKIDKLLTSYNVETLSGYHILELEKNTGLPALLTEKHLIEKGLNFAESDYLEELQTWKKDFSLKEETFV